MYKKVCGWGQMRLAAFNEELAEGKSEEGSSLGSETSG